MFKKYGFIKSDSEIKKENEQLQNKINEEKRLIREKQELEERIRRETENKRKKELIHSRITEIFKIIKEFKSLSKYDLLFLQTTDNKNYYIKQENIFLDDENKIYLIYKEPIYHYSSYSDNKIFDGYKEHIISFFSESTIQGIEIIPNKSKHKYIKINGLTYMNIDDPEEQITFNVENIDYKLSSLDEFSTTNIINYIINQYEYMNSLKNDRW